MKPTFFNSAFVRAPGRLIERNRPWKRAALPVRWGMFEHPDLGLTLIDTGYGARTFSDGVRKAALKLYALADPKALRAEGTVQAVLAAQGRALDEVQTIIITHLHADHVSELRSFPQAKLIGSRRAIEAVKAAGWRAALKHGVFLELLPEGFEERLEAVEDLPTEALPKGLGMGWTLVPGELSLVPLAGHAVGHFGLLFHKIDMLYAADAFWSMQGLRADPSFTFFTALISDSDEASQESFARLLRFEKEGGKVVLCHDPQPSDYDAA